MKAMEILEHIYKAEDIMNKNFLKVALLNSLGTVINLMLQHNYAEAILVDSKDELKGIFTRKELAQFYNQDSLQQKPIIDFASQNVLTVDSYTSVWQVSELLEKNSQEWALVVQNNQVVGVLGESNIRDSFYLKIKGLFSLQAEILDNIHEAVCICDVRGKVIYWNKSSENLYGVSRKEIIGKYVSRFFPQALTLTVLEKKKPIINKRHEPVEGKSVILSTLPIFNQNNELIAVVSTDRDITEQVVLSQKLEYAEKSVEILKNSYSKEIASKYSFPNIIGKNKEIIQAMALAQKVAPTSTSVLITGESGTGKEIFAKAIHEASGRKGQFVAVNCTAIPESLLESELFGYVEGAFTSAVKKGKIGMFEIANNGTLFLDEIGDMPFSMQGKLLRVLQDGVIYRLGSEKPINTNTRIIAATNKNLKEAINTKQFREDLFYRLAVFQLELPPLRNRKEDLKDLIDLFISDVCLSENIEINTIDEKIYYLLSSYDWPGNIRELRNVIQRMVVLSHKGNLTSNNIPQYILADVEDHQGHGQYDLEYNREKLERSLIKEVLELTKGNKQKAAEILKIKRTTLYYKLKQYGLELEKRQ